MSLSSSKRKFAICGLGVTKTGHVPEYADYTGRAIQTEAARLAIEDAGLRREDIDGAIDPLGTLGVRSADVFPRVLGLPVKFFFSVERGGAPTSYALISALAFLEAGLANYVLIAKGGNGWSASRFGKLKREGEEVRERPGLWGRPFGDSGAVCHHTFLASRHMHEYGTTSRQLGAVAVAERQWACLNPAATMYGRPITIEDHQKSPMVVWPYHLLDLCLQSDGGEAIIVTTAERARECKKPPVYILGIGTGEAMEKLWWEKANYTQMALDTAKEAAFRQSGIELKDVDVAELYDCFTMEVILQLEGFGWCKKGEGGPFVEAGNIAPGGTIPVNTGGGLLSSHHHGDFTPIAEAIRQVRGEGGARQVQNAEIALATGYGGEAVAPGMCSTHTCIIFGK